jgi:hypothetical protein
VRRAISSSIEIPAEDAVQRAHRTPSSGFVACQDREDEPVRHLMLVAFEDPDRLDVKTYDGEVASMMWAP